MDTTLTAFEDPHLKIGRALDQVTAELEATLGDRFPTAVIAHVAAEAAAAAIRKSVANRAEHRLKAMKVAELAQLTALVGS